MSLKCNCQTSMNGSRCKHMAALLFEIEDEYAMEIFPKQERKKKKNEEQITLTFEDDGKPHYLSFKDTLSRYYVYATTYNKALKIYEKGNYEIDDEWINSDRKGNKELYFYVNVYENRHNAKVSIHLGRYGIGEVDCLDDDSWFESSVYDECLITRPDESGKIELCVHKTVAFLVLFDFIRKNRDKVDYSDSQARNIISSFRKEINLPVVSSKVIDIEPKILCDKYPKKECYLSFSINIDGGKYSPIKNIEELILLAKNKKSYKLSTLNSIDFASVTLTERAEKALKLMKEAETEIVLRTYNDYCPGHLRENISLKRNFDSFFEIMKDTKVLLEKAPLLGMREIKPTFTMNISEMKVDGTAVGVHVNGVISGQYRTDDYTYWFQDGYLNRAENKSLGSAASLLSIADANGNFSFDVGLDIIGSFYHRVLPELRKYGRVSDSAFEEIEGFLTDQPEVIFYVSLLNERIYCKATISYRGTETTITKRSTYDTSFNGLKDEICDALDKMIPNLDYTENGWYLYERNDEAVYNFIHNGIPILMEIGTVNVTDDIKKMVVRKMPHVTSEIDIDENDDSILNFTLDLQGLTIEELVEILQSYNDRKKFHKLKNGDFISLEGMNLDSLRDLFISSGIPIKDFVDGKMHLPLYRALYLDQILQSQNGIQFEGGQKFRRLVKEFKTINESDYEVPSSLSGTLRSYQKDGYRWMRVLFEHGFGGILADDMGLGKTVQALSLLLSLKEEGKGGTALIVSPASLVFNWKAECTKFTPSLKATTVTGTAKERERIISSAEEWDILITSYDLLKRDIALYEGIKFNIEIIDEAQFIKNHNTAQAKAVRAVSSKHRLALTGTPIENRLLELWSIFEYLMPGFLFSQESFKKYISSPIEKSGDKDAAMRLRKLTGPFILRRIKSDVLKDLPDKIEETRVTPLEGEQKKLYTAEVAKTKGMLKGSKDYNEKKIEILAELTRIRQICCDPSLVYSDYKGESSKREATIDLIKSAIDGGHKILLFSQFTSMLALLEDDLKKEEISYYKITGETGKAKRIELVDAFNSDSTPLFLISLKAGGTGLNLTAADIVIHYDPWWNIAVQNQATDRAHRIGQTKQVTVYKMICENTIEEKIVKLQETKRDLANEIVSTENMSLSTLTKEDLMELLDISNMA